MGAAFGIGFILGPALGGLLGDFGARAPFFAAAALALVNMAYGFFVLPESLAPEARRPFHWHRANTLGTLVQLRKYPAVMALATVMFAWVLAHQVLPSTWAFYMKEKFGWSSTEIGVSLAVAGVMMASVQAGLTRVLVPRLGERAAVLVGAACGLAGYLGYAFISQGWMVYAVMVIGMLQGLTFPSLNALMSQQIPKNAQGELQGAVASIFSLTTIVGPVMMTQLFGYFSSTRAPVYFPGAAFLFAGLLVVVALALFLRTTRHAPPHVEANAEIDTAPQSAPEAEAGEASVAPSV
jgi:DHA1 family tetracycline resistance protein-like MFS transporter